MGNLKKVLIWRVISIVITLVITGMWTGSVAKASGLTVILHTTLLCSHWLFERWWLNKTVNKILAPEKNLRKKNLRKKTASGLDGWDHHDWRPVDK